MSFAAKLLCAFVLLISSEALALSGKRTQCPESDSLQEFRELLRRRGYSEKYAKVLGAKAGVLNLRNFGRARLESLSRDNNDPFLKLLLFGGTLSAKEVKDAGISESLRRGLVCRGLMEKVEDGFNLGGLALESVRYSGKDIFFLVDHPKIDEGANPLRLFTTGFALLEFLSKVEEGRVMPEGTVVDFGTGTGLLAIALLVADKDSRKIKEAIGLEIDERLVKMAELNADLNGVGDRFKALMNNSPDLLKTYLKNRPVDFVISNPPFVAVPEKFSNSLPAYADGGELGTEIILLMFRQMLPFLSSSAEIVFVAELALNDKRVPFLQKQIEDLTPLKHNLCISLWKNPKLMKSRNSYARLLKGYFRKYNGENVEASEVERMLKRLNIREVSPFFVRFSLGNLSGCAKEVHLEHIDAHL